MANKQTFLTDFCFSFLKKNRVISTRNGRYPPEIEDVKENHHLGAEMDAEMDAWWLVTEALQCGSQAKKASTQLGLSQQFTAVLIYKQMKK